MEVLGKGFSFLNTQIWNKDRGRYFVVETIDFVLEIPHIEYYCLIAFFPIEHGMFVFFFKLKFLINKRSINFCNDFPIIWLCEFFVV